MNFEIIKTKYGNQSAYKIGDYLFQKHSNYNENKMYLRCKERTCRAKAKNNRR